MEALLEILFRASVSMAVLYALYWLLLRQLTHFTANRYFLLISVIASVTLALVPIQYQVNVQMAAQETIKEFNGTFNHNVESTDSPIEQSISLSSVLYLIYGIGAAVVLLRLLIQCRKPMLIITKSKPKKINDCLIHENKVYNSPFSFFNRIFINPEYFQQDEISDILTHEKVHIQERHWIDLFIIELLTVFFWFNPFIWLFERAIKQNHEYLADEGVLTRGHSPVRYQALLINRLMGTQIIGLANHFSVAQGPTRFKMMTKEKTAKRKLFRMIWGIPVLAILLVAFAEPDYRTITNESPVNNTSELLNTGKTIKVKGSVKDKNGNSIQGAAIIIKGSSVATITDSNGNYEIGIPKEGEWKLMASSIGYKVVSNTLKLESSTDTEWECDFILEAKKEKITISGKVTDENGNALPGTSIVLKTATIGTVVDWDGSFKLDIPKSKKMDLVISFVGYKTVVKRIDPLLEKQNLTIQMKRGVVSIDSKTSHLDGNVPPPPPPPAPANIKSGFVIVEEMPEYNQGRYGLAQYVKKQKSKLRAKFGKKLNGTATVGFTIDTKGNVTNIQLLEKSSETTARAAKIIAKEMEQWKPGSQRGKNVTVDFAMELEF